MPRSRRTTIAALLALAAFGTLVDQTGVASQAATTGLGDWPSYERGELHSSAAYGTAVITAANAGSLHAAWHWTPPAGDLEASATVAGGRVYIGTGAGTFYALDAATGAVAWSRALDVGVTAACKGKGIEATATVANDPVTGTPTVYAEGARYLYALNAGTGAVIWKHIVGPTTTSSFSDYYNWSSPTVVAGHVYVGLSSRCDKPLIRGGEVQFDQHTGAVQHTYYTMPSGHTGGSIWSSAAYRKGYVWLSTGNPDSGGTFDSYSIVRLDGTTMAKLDKWTVPNLTVASDYDFGSSPTLFPNSSGTRLLAACNKDGILYALKANALSGGPVWSRRLANPGQCLTNPAWDYVTARLYAAADTTTINGATVPGAARALDPTTGAVLWQRALPCAVFGSPTLDQPGHLLAVPMYNCATGVTPTIQLLDATNGAVVGSLPAPGGAFSQPVFAGDDLYVASFTGGLTAYTVP
jgi:polyvinyl alcohol dehydrogenase (cytochrome)